MHEPLCIKRPLYLKPLKPGVILTSLTQPSAIKVGLTLCLASIIFGVILYIAEYIIDTEITGVGVISTILPAMITGIYWGSKNGEYLPTKTRWLALTIWIAASFIYAFAVFYYYQFSFAEIVDMLNELGWFNLIILVILIIAFLISYVAFKFGEKTGIKSLLQKKAKAEKLESNL